jgi:diacylglycerol kinase family enzyme
MGGAFFMAPGAVTNDGQLDLCIAGAPRRAKMLALIVKYLGGSQEGDPHITTGRTRKFSIRAVEGALPIHADGETISEDHASLEVECVPQALRIIRPAPGVPGSA